MDQADGTRERKRRFKAMPRPAGTHGATGVLAVVLAFFTFLAAGTYATTHERWSAIIALPLLAATSFASWSFARGAGLLWRVRREWAARGVRCMVVRSDSLAWSEHIAARWLPRLGTSAVVLNWSERSRWPRSLEAEVFHHFCEPGGNFNPAVVVFRGLGTPLVFRFYRAFHEVKAGRPQYLEEMEQRMLEAVGVGTAPR